MTSTGSDSVKSLQPRNAAAPAIQPEDPSVGDLVKDASTHMSTLIRSEIELAKTELMGTVKKAGISIALFVVAAAVLLFSLTFAFIGLAEGIHALGLYRWASYLTVFGLLVLIAALAGFIGFRLIKRVSKPERTMTTVKDTASWAKHPTKTA
ncbi:MAG TPA: phage holin family protein [Mycobacteriales bacterium]|nr:phage holin family protein [Mycobacteriales bacterium]